MVEEEIKAKKQERYQSYLEEERRQEEVAREKEEEERKKIEEEERRVAEEKKRERESTERRIRAEEEKKRLAEEEKRREIEEAQKSEKANKKKEKKTAGGKKKVWWTVFIIALCGGIGLIIHLSSQPKEKSGNSSRRSTNYTVSRKKTYNIHSGDEKQSHLKSLKTNYSKMGSSDYPAIEPPSGGLLELFINGMAYTPGMAVEAGQIRFKAKWDISKPAGKPEGTRVNLHVTTTGYARELKRRGPWTEWTVDFNKIGIYKGNISDYGGQWGRNVSGITWILNIL